MPSSDISGCDNTDLFSKCANLKNLTLIGCNMKGFKVLSICLPLLSNLKLNQSACGGVEVIKIDATQLKNLNITDFQIPKTLSL
ncbi:hypothetical protein HanRHA438_Chr14g0632371 [Helianthus annuus]|uniref:Leucine-rich repeat domain, L domain-like protein n=1 Tax=Helianthus annuus TaxID=4232 RepID=A0A9K3H4S1_HELAN|nr:hypothetical protein HanXRQr2_Chr14g0622411 [Helianthus annuus]KAJ0462862.1 hypothetical protein HanHA300_Chr14g0508761 [Helianthus annuus]KAJ0484208.1 hypothetical protein HanHA89_Chr14g0541541 [Helianthus annuus]KAJ0838650.1 hypothetical protein HanPSC8_Chr14g0597281 [Helianthus annuus]KAJ0851924.1 hypothetical protein HanRHA438_Chr14g0632371 [Helianthus annuus]